MEDTLKDLAKSVARLVGVPLERHSGNDQTFHFDVWVRPPNDDRTPIRKQLVRLTAVTDTPWLLVGSTIAHQSASVDLPSLTRAVRPHGAFRVVVEQQSGQKASVIVLETSHDQRTVTPELLARSVQQVANLADMFEQTLSSEDRE